MRWIKRMSNKHAFVYLAVCSILFFILERMRGSVLFSLTNNEGDYCHSSQGPSLPPSASVRLLWVLLLSPLGLVTVALNWFSYLVSAYWGMTATVSVPSACSTWIWWLLSSTQLEFNTEIDTLLLMHSRWIQVEQGSCDGLTDNMCSIILHNQQHTCSAHTHATPRAMRRKEDQWGCRD